MTGEERRQQILEAALEVFAENGFSGARTKDIARKAGISETLIFQHFDTKENLYREALNSLFTHHPIMHELAESLEHEDDEGVLYNLAHHMISHGRQDPRISRLMLFSGLEGLPLTAQAHEQRQATGERIPEMELAQYLEKRMRAGAIKRMDPKIAAKLFMYLIFMLVADHHLTITNDGFDMSDQEAANTITYLYLNGMRP
jgi:TetR/AcrR family transcriptional regulator